MLNPYKSVTFACPKCGWSMTLPQLSSARIAKNCPKCVSEALDLHQSTVGEQLAAMVGNVFRRDMKGTRHG